MKMELNISNIEKGRKIVVNPRYGGGYEFVNRTDHNLDITDGSTSTGFWIIVGVLFLIFWRVAIGDPTPQDDRMEQVRHEKISKRPVQRI